MTRDQLRTAFGKHLPKILGATIAAAIVATYIGMMHNAGVVDDPWLTTNNPYVQSLSGLRTLLTKDVWTGTAVGESSNFYRPVFMCSFLVNRMLFGNTPESYHLGNLLIHLGAALLFYRLLSVILKGERRWAVWLFALWFAVAPLNSESVVWARCDALGALFTVAALLANRLQLRAWRTAGVICATTAAIFTKESFACLPLLLVADDVLVLERRPANESPKLAGVLGVLVLYFLARIVVGVPSASVIAGIPASALIGSYLYLVATYAARAAVPTSLEAFRPYAPLSTSVSVAVLLAILFVTALLARAARRATALRARAAAFGWVWFLATLVPASTAGPNLGLVGDRYAYFPMMGLCVAVAAGLDALIVRLPRRASAATLCALLAGIFAQAMVTRARVRDWRDEDTLFRASLRRDPANSYALCALGVRAAQDRRWPEAEQLLRRSLALESRSFRAHNAMCVVALNTERLAEAEAECRASLAIHSANPRAWVNLASVYIHAQKWAPCVEAAGHAIDVKKLYPEAHHLRALCLANGGRIPEAIVENRTALALEPTHAGSLSLAAQMRSQGLIP